ncbi:signal peptide [Streptococcus pseudoporcinus]|uniref:Signal peptide n=2 Tax=Streptococcus pseudoporcinus TaxID=361101 RepID=A0A4V6Z3N2_9STRE|nr:signal peptide [Streptococcus pseudoporcinus]VUC65076.1 signal peptide [Streptococcus pseudoporcinus]VUC95803.1 signal peptide [Streptococcus pseudoporcinus]VUC96196.1 signal peptide [Streptococcus pseudoporcinus]
MKEGYNGLALALIELKYLSLESVNRMKTILIILFWTCLAFAVYSAIDAKSWVTKVFGYNYLIQFVGVTKGIDLKESPKVMKKIKIVSASRNQMAYSVQSRINDHALKELIMAEFDLRKDQVIIQSEQLSGVLGVA